MTDAKCALLAYREKALSYDGNLLLVLENFMNGHKARSATVTVDNGYGATCWEVSMTTEKGSISVSEDDLMANTRNCCIPGCDGDLCQCDDWPGLTPVLYHALIKVGAITTI